MLDRDRKIRIVVSHLKGAKRAAAIEWLCKNPDALIEVAPWSKHGPRGHLQRRISNVTRWIKD